MPESTTFRTVICLALYSRPVSDKRSIWSLHGTDWQAKSGVVLAQAIAPTVSFDCQAR